ncbi:cytochrome c peroxidase [Cellulophaga lytica]|uniref:cytochrome-c peroxidase n=1 Tax=Cellulophaga lytica TaxID=979 RepID=UPI0009504239|nr:cytochrome c peroxidase [Cellulophaga lytica]APU09646.1 cytochrome-c peroxidase [Cellulophaga lytica]MDO6854843.1 cytochrome c peroxidase [Cellulophaga lytica]
MKKISFFLVVLAFVSCQSDDDGYTNIPVELEVPAHFPEVTYNLAHNPLTKNGIELGRKLFYEGAVSSTGTVSCGTCHEQKYAFTHHGHTFSHGVNDLEGTRNTPPVQNMAFLENFAWDGATGHLDLFPVIPITTEVEMDETLENVIAKLKNKPDYKALFAAAFEDGEVNSENFLLALSQFMVTMISADAKYDKYINNQVQLTEIEQQGLVLFEQKCASCHATALFSDGSFRNNGLQPNTKLNDLGRSVVTGFTEDNYKFKVPSLRNIAVTAPYMHDGRFGSLEAVLAFYDSGVVDSQTLDPLLRSGERLGIATTAEERVAIIAFLNTLTDNTFLTDGRFSEK